MRLSEIIEALEAEVLVEGPEELEIHCGGGSDSVSDVLVYGKPGMLLLTGLTRPSVVQAVEVIGAAGLVFVRGKRPEDSLLAMARRVGVPVLLSPHSLYDSCGRLYVRGLPGVIVTQESSAGRSD